MTKQILFVHWKTVRLGFLPFVLAAFALPLLVADGLAVQTPVLSSTATAVALAGASTWISLFPMLAAGVGCLLALSAWNWDHKTNHVYALSLPISRQRYAFLKFSAGALLALIPAAALLAGSLVAVISVDLPAGLHAYPLQLTRQFLLGTLIVYAILFSLASGTIRTTVIILSILVGVPMLLSMGQLRPVMGEPVSYWLGEALRYGPFRVLFGNWLLFDV